jgi:hypothetical protein
MRPISEIIVHTSATRRGWMDNSTAEEKRDEIRRWHVNDRKWSDIGYHHIIDRDGTLAEGRPLSRTGAHVRGHNTGTIGVCLIGGHGGNENDVFEDHYTQAQEDALRMYIANMKRQFPSIKKVTGHNQYAAKACPCFDVPRWLARKPQRTSMVQSTTLQAAGVTGAGGAVGVITALSSLERDTQIIVAVAAVFAAAGLLYIARERVRKWARGDR